MEYLEGGELLHYVASKGCLSEEETKVYIKQIANAIYYCHTFEKLIHRDLKLENVLLVKKDSRDIKV